MSTLPRSVYQKIASLQAQTLTSDGEAPYTFAPESAKPTTDHDLLAEHLAGMAMAATMGLIADGDGDGSVSQHPRGSASDPEQEFAQAELIHQIESLLETLDAEEHEIVRRHYFGSEGLEKIAQDLDISKSWASRLHTRALSRLAKRLQT